MGRQSQLFHKVMMYSVILNLCHLVVRGKDTLNSVVYKTVGLHNTRLPFHHCAVTATDVCSNAVYNKFINLYCIYVYKLVVFTYCNPTCSC